MVWSMLYSILGHPGHQGLHQYFHFFIGIPQTKKMILIWCGYPKGDFEVAKDLPRPCSDYLLLRWIWDRIYCEETLIQKKYLLNVSVYDFSPISRKSLFHRWPYLLHLLKNPNSKILKRFHPSVKDCQDGEILFQITLLKWEIFKVSWIFTNE